MVSKPCSNLLSGYLSDNVERYLTKSGMATDCIWATDLEFLGTANLIAIDIAVWSFKEQQLTWLKYSASNKLNQLISHTILLENKNNNHFNAVLSLKT